MGRAAIWGAAFAALAVIMGGSRASSTTWTHGYDVSWPQCSGSAAHHLPRSSPSYVILGLTHGTGHTANPCLGAQLSWARDRGARIGAYLVPSFPSAAQLRRAGQGPWGAGGNPPARRPGARGARPAL